MIVSDEEAKEMLARAEAATKGPWTVTDGGGIMRVLRTPTGQISRAGPVVVGEPEPYEGGGGFSDVDGVFIAAARSDVPRLVAALLHEREKYRIYVRAEEASLRAELAPDAPELHDVGSEYPISIALVAYKRERALVEAMDGPCRPCNGMGRESTGIAGPTRPCSTCGGGKTRKAAAKKKLKEETK